MYIPIWIIVVLIWGLLSILCGYKTNKHINEMNATYRRDNPTNKDDILIPVILFSPFVFLYMFIVKMFFEDWD